MKNADIKTPTNFPKIPENWHRFQRTEYDEILVHNTKLVWIVYREKIDNTRPAHYCAYRNVAHIPKGRHPWSVDNRRIHKENKGFKTLAEAIKAAEAAESLTQ